MFFTRDQMFKRWRIPFIASGAVNTEMPAGHVKIPIIGFQASWSSGPYWSNKRAGICLFGLVAFGYATGSLSRRGGWFLHLPHLYFRRASLWYR